MHTQKLTKIVATIGPASETEDKLEDLLKSGANVLRFNTKHSTPEWHREHIRLAQSVADRLGTTIGILLDLQGPEIRLETRDKKDIDFPSLIENDIRQLDVNSANKIDFVGLSFVRSAHDIVVLRAEMLKRMMKSQIVAKIESQPALDRLDEIIEEADVVMIARGDLGVEVPYEQLAYWQRVIIDKCRVAHKPVITATQMLESMIVNPRPTRAEVTDVAHAIFEGTDAIMLSGESAGG